MTVTRLIPILIAGTLLAQAPAGAPPRPPVSEEYLLLGNASRGAGEPMIAVDPTDPRNMIAVAMGSVQQLHGKPAVAGGTDEYHLVANSTITWVGVTHDAGVTWDVKELPMLSGKLTRCPDSFADVTKDGVFIAGCEPRETASDPDFWGMSALTVSRDKGHTWGPVVQLISDFQLTRFAPGLKPVSGGYPPKSPTRVASNSPWDRPYTYIDDSTGAIYGVAMGGSAVVDEAAGTRRSQAYVTASTDGGRTFTTIYAWDSPQYPHTSRGISATAGHGLFAGVYIAGSAPAAENVTCPCPILAVSRDRGKTFTYTVLRHVPMTAAASQPPAAPSPAPPAVNAGGGAGAGGGQPARGRAGAGGAGGGGGGGRGGGGANGGLAGLSLDPTTPGRLALLRNEGTRFSVSVSPDNGATWSPFVTAGTVPDAVSFTKSAFEFSRDGVLGLIWRASYADRSYDIWAAISRDGGRTFSKSLRVSHGRSPASDPYRNAGLFGDDIQDLSMDKDNLHVVWGDSRAGFQGVWYGRVALKDFEF